ncbi:DUF3108 domain-containing protein [Leeia sp. TBRC 13508]|uniref:DUF3108 domain-containing protein n=1 Tax=Leeia speluncae TaxID=2884804 RepID=A0ABS8D2W4_9NEIS|nr:DUF3108 domain-containing protein [Leeia speluncae]MCB6182542.1 DUF3108 domain-containing protein [Leeia speluncae]
MKPFKRLLIAATLSLLIHSCAIVSEVVILPDWATSEQKVLKTRLLKATKKLSIQQTEATHKGITAGIASSGQSKSGSKKEGVASEEKKQPSSTEKLASKETPASTNAQPESTASSRVASVEHPASKPTDTKPLAKENVASVADIKTGSTKLAKSDEQRFPNEGKAVYRLKGSSIDARQTWSVTKDGYTVEMKMALFNKSAHYISKGKITDEGIAPDSFADIRDDNDTPKHIAEFDYKARELRYGEPNQLTTEPLAPNTQDILSMGYQLAVQLSPGTSIDLNLVTGKKLYKIRFSADNEEEIDTPVGVIRSAHVKGKELNGNREFDIWLDLDHQNFPVRLKGIDNNGKAVDLQLVGLTFGQKTIYRYQDYQYPSSRK